jgi:hypothetical protein
VQKDALDQNLGQGLSKLLPPMIVGSECIITSSDESAATINDNILDAIGGE